MLTPEDFRRRLNTSIENKKKTDQEKLRAEKAAALERQTRENEDQWRQRDKTLARQKEEKQKNQYTLEFASQFPIKEYLKIIKDEIAPKQKIQEWGPDNGEIAYSLAYNKRWSLIDVSSHKIMISPGTSNKGGGSPSVWGSRTETSFRLVEKILAARINNDGTAGLFHEICANSDFYEKDRNPLNWAYGHQRQYTEGFGYYAKKRTVWEWNKGVLLKVNINSSEGAAQFIQKLADFYVSLKSGR